MFKIISAIRYAVITAVVLYLINVMVMGPKAFSFSRAPRPVEIELPAPSPTPTVTEAPPAVGSPRIRIGKIIGATPAEIEMIHAGAELATNRLAGHCYKQWVLAATYTENEGLTQQQIWDKMVAHDVSVDVEMYTGSWKANHVWKTVGYESDPWDGVVHMNRYFVKTAEAVGDNLVHEHKGHSVGFHHFGVKATSQPYGQNYAYEGCAKQMMQGRGAKAYKPPGIRLEIRKAKKL